MNTTSTMTTPTKYTRPPAPLPAAQARPHGSGLTYAELRQIILEQLG
jgi:hypothetical protein